MSRARRRLSYSNKGILGRAQELICRHVPTSASGRKRPELAGAVRRTPDLPLVAHAGRPLHHACGVVPLPVPGRMRGSGRGSARLPETPAFAGVTAQDHPRGGEDPCATAWRHPPDDLQEIDGNHAGRTASACRTGGDGGGVWIS